nr:RNA-dependent RNA polymerase [Colletotrichum curcumae narnavirus 1]
MLKQPSDCGGPRAPSIPVGSNPQDTDRKLLLPRVFTNTLKDRHGLSDGQIDSSVRSNPIVSLCLRLSTIDVGRKGRYCYDPKLYGLQMSSTSRLFSMIGKYVSRGTFKRMCACSPHQWKFVEECWIANMHTVLLNCMFDPIKRDRKLFRAIRRYKLWFVNFIFSGKVSTFFSNKFNKKVTKFIPINFERALVALKNIAGILQWSLVSDLKEYNAPHPIIPYWKGWNSSLGTLTMVWFEGHLSRCRDYCKSLDHSDLDLANLCQIRTFGRALPCPTKVLCRQAYSEQVGILLNEKKTEESVLKTVKSFSRRLGERLGICEMPYQTHVSVSTSGCFERSQREFGLAGEASDMISSIDCTVDLVGICPNFNCPTTGQISNFEDFLHGGGASDLIDPYGEMLFPRPPSFYRAGLSLQRAKKGFLETLYGGVGNTTKKRIASKYLKGKPLPPSLGKICLWVSCCRSLQQGTFNIKGKSVDPGYTLFINGQRYYAWSKHQFKNNLEYTPLDFPKVRLDCLAEPGAKTRPLGKNQAWFTFVSRAMRFMAEPILARDGRARIGLRSTNKLWSFLKYIQKREVDYLQPVAQSSDFKSATDLIPLDIIEALWSGFCHSLPKSHPFWVFYKLIICNRSMYNAPKYARDEFFDDGTLNRRGSFMGEPMSFLTLTLVNLVIEEISAHYYMSRQPLFSATPSPDLVGDPTAICGDDVASVRRDLRQVKLFKQTTLAMGLKFSWKDAVSRRVMIFCEDHILLVKEGKRTRFEYVDVIKSRLLTSMAREHSENRSSILGKGRMLRNQTDYFQDDVLRIAVFSYYHSIFNRIYRGELGKVRLPIYLPPCAGGIGVPIHETLIPGFMYPYIGYVFSLLDIEDYFTKYCELESLSALNSRVKHGISIRDNNVLRMESARYKRAVNPSLDVINPNCVYESDFIVELLKEVHGIKIPLNPYDQSFDWSSLENEASRIGFVPFSSLSEEIERLMNFHEFFSNHKVREQRTYNKWVKDSNRFWRKKINSSNRSKLSDLGRRRFSSLAGLERKIQRAFSGFIYIGDTDVGFNLINSGPSLKVSFSKGNVNSPLKVSSTRIHASILEGMART